MEIMIGKGYKLTSDTLNVILNKRYDQKDKEGNIIGEAFKTIGYYSTIYSACNALIEREIKDSDAISLDGLKKHVEDVKEQIFEALKSIKPIK